MISPARQAAEQIAALINSRVQSPRVDEMEAIVAGVMTCQHTSVIAMTPVGGFAPGEEDFSLAALQQKVDAVHQLYEEARGIGRGDAHDLALDKANAGDSELSAIARRVFDARPITLSNLKQRAVLARYWHQYAYDVEAWVKPEDCGHWEDEVIAQLIHGVLQIDTPGRSGI
jgi:hypothetical protein